MIRPDLLEPINLRYEWKIPNFDKEVESSPVGKELCSAKFLHPSMPDIRFHLQLYPNGDIADAANHVSIYLYMTTTTINKGFTLRVKHRFYLVNELSLQCQKREETYDYKMAIPKATDNRGWRKYCTKEQAMGFLQKDKSLVFVCEVEFIPIDKKEDVKMENTIHTLDEPSLFLNRQLDLFKSGEGSDFVIECGSEKFRVHKSFLIAHSSVFRTLLTGNKSDSGLLKITGSSPTAIKQMLTYIYSGTLPDDFSPADTKPLLAVAANYELHSLKTFCEGKMIEGLKDDELLSMFSFADTHKAMDLFNACLSKIHDNIYEIMDTEEWNQLETTTPRLTSLICKRMLLAPQGSVHNKIKKMYYRY